MSSKKQLYVMKNSIGMYKIGISCNPHKRRREVQAAGGLEVELVEIIDTSPLIAKDVENYLHKGFSSNRLHGEWFSYIGVEGTVSIRVQTLIDFKNNTFKSTDSSNDKNFNSCSVTTRNTFDKGMYKIIIGNKYYFSARINNKLFRKSLNTSDSTTTTILVERIVETTNGMFEDFDMKTIINDTIKTLKEEINNQI